MNRVMRRTRKGTVDTGRRNDSVSLCDMDRRRLGSRSGFDGTASNRLTNNHFADASATDITSLISQNRDVMVNRCRYEYRNNAYGRAMTQLWGNEIVGTGPTLQMQTDNNRFNTRVEELWTEWAKYCDASEKQNLGGLLRTALIQWPQFGEEFTTYRNVRPNSLSAQRTEITLRLLEINPQRISSPFFDPSGNTADGIQIDDETGAPVKYLVYKSHPASTNRLVSLQSTEVMADNMLHLYITDEAGQYRGFPSMAPVVTLMGDLRRYTKAVVAAAEQAANISGVIYSDMSVTQATATANAMEEIEIARNALLTLPMGYKAESFTASQPTNTYKEFKTELIGEIGRAFFMPFIVASGNAQGYNYSSGRLDLQEWWKAVGIVQDYIGERKLDFIFARFIEEAILLNMTMPGYLPGFTKKIQQLGIWGLKHKWNWPGHEHVDPKKEADAQKVRLENKTTTLAAEYAKQGKDWETEVEQIARERQKLRELNMLDDEDELSMVERIQKIYLGVGVVINDEEVRQILNGEKIELQNGLPENTGGDDE